MKPVILAALLLGGLLPGPAMGVPSEHLTEIRIRSCVHAQCVELTSAAAERSLTGHLVVFAAGALRVWPREGGTEEQPQREYTGEGYYDLNSQHLVVRTDRQEVLFQFKSGELKEM